MTRSTLARIRRNRPVYAATLYLDKDGDAAVANRHLGYFPSIVNATHAINAVRETHDGSDGWFTGGIEYGMLWELVPGESPEYFEADERESSWFVGLDGKADR